VTTIIYNKMNDQALVMNDNYNGVSRSHAMPKKIRKIWP